MSSDNTANSDHSQPLGPDKEPLSWDGNYARVLGLLHYLWIHLERYTMHIPYITKRTAMVRGRLAAEAANIVPLVLGTAEEPERTLLNICPPPAERIKQVNDWRAKQRPVIEKYDPDDYEESTDVFLGPLYVQEAGGRLMGTLHHVFGHCDASEELFNAARGDPWRLVTALLGHEVTIDDYAVVMSEFDAVKATGVVGDYNPSSIDVWAKKINKCLVSFDPKTAPSDASLIQLVDFVAFRDQANYSTYSTKRALPRSAGGSPGTFNEAVTLLKSIYTTKLRHEQLESVLAGGPMTQQGLSVGPAKHVPSMSMPQQQQQRQQLSAAAPPSAAVDPATALQVKQLQLMSAIAAKLSGVPDPSKGLGGPGGGKTRKQRDAEKKAKKVAEKAAAAAAAAKGKTDPPRDPATGKVTHWIEGMSACNECGGKHLHGACKASQVGAAAEDALSGMTKEQLVEQCKALLGATTLGAVGVCEEQTQHEVAMLGGGSEWCAPAATDRARRPRGGRRNPNSPDPSLLAPASADAQGSARGVASPGEGAAAWGPSARVGSGSVIPNTRPVPRLPPGLGLISERSLINDLINEPSLINSSSELKSIGPSAPIASPVGGRPLIGVKLISKQSLINETLIDESANSILANAHPCTSQAARAVDLARSDGLVNEPSISALATSADTEPKLDSPVPPRHLCFRTGVSGQAEGRGAPYVRKSSSGSDHSSPPAVPPNQGKPAAAGSRGRSFDVSCLEPSRLAAAVDDKGGDTTAVSSGYLADPHAAGKLSNSPHVADVPRVVGRGDHPALPVSSSGHSSPRLHPLGSHRGAYHGQWLPSSDMSSYVHPPPTRTPPPSEHVALAAPSSLPKLSGVKLPPSARLSLAERLVELCFHAAIDSGCTGSMTPDRRRLIDVKPCNETFKAANGTLARASCIGSMPALVKMSDGSAHMIIFTNVRCVPAFKYTLLSVTQLWREQSIDAKFANINALQLSNGKLTVPYVSGKALPSVNVVSVPMLLTSAPFKSAHVALPVASSPDGKAAPASREPPSVSTPATPATSSSAPRVDPSTPASVHPNVATRRAPPVGSSTASSTNSPFLNEDRIASSTPQQEAHHSSDGITLAPPDGEEPAPSAADVPASKGTSSRPLGLHKIGSTSHVARLPASQAAELMHRRSHAGVAKTRALPHTTADAPKILASAPASTTCVSCAQAHITKASHSGTLSAPAPEPGILHFDMKELVVARGGYRYVVFLIDEHTRYIFYDFIKLKSEAAAAVMRCIAAFDATVATPLDDEGRALPRPRVRRIHSDREGKLMSIDFREYRAKGLFHHTISPPHDHDLNPIAESTIHTIDTLATAFKLASGAPASFWPYLIRNAVDVHNSTATSLGSSTGGATTCSTTRRTLG